MVLYDLVDNLFDVSKLVYPQAWTPTQPTTLNIIFKAETSIAG